MALTSLVLACKYIEKDDDIPLIDEIIRSAPITRRTVVYDDVTKAEVKICSYLKWDLNIVTPQSFLENYMS
jgi:hypothetical protein